MFSGVGTGRGGFRATGVERTRRFVPLALCFFAFLRTMCAEGAGKERGGKGEVYHCTEQEKVENQQERERGKFGTTHGFERSA